MNPPRERSYQSAMSNQHYSPSRQLSFQMDKNGEVQVLFPPDQAPFPELITPGAKRMDQQFVNGQFRRSQISQNSNNNNSQ